MIRPDERLSRLLERDPALVEVLAQAAPVLEPLRRRGIGRIVGRVLTVERAARLAGLDPEELARRLEGGGQSASGAGKGAAAPARAAIDDEHEREAVAAPAQKRGALMATGAEATKIPGALAAVPPELIVDADVRETLRAGSEPFGEIMAARRRLPPGGVLRVRAIFEPAPLYFVLGAQGLDHWTERLADDDWRVWFFASSGAEDAAAPASSATGAAASGEAEDGNVVVLDVRGLEPPEPMLQTLAALDDLPAGATLVQLNVRVPRFLLPMLEDRGFSYEIREQGPTLVRTLIRRR